VTIEDYSFGRIKIAGRTYTSDVIVFPDRVKDAWWRKEGHRLDPADLTDAVAVSPAVLVIGTGDLGVMQVPQETLAWLRALGSDVRLSRNPDAVRSFNERSRS